MTALAAAVPVNGRKGGERTREVARAALACFTNGGFRLTQIVHVSERMGVSVGTIYRYVESKEALFHIAALEAAGELPEGVELPVKVAGVGDTVAVIGELVARDRLWPFLQSAANAPPPVDVKAEARVIADELYMAISARAALISLLDHCAQEIPQLAEIFDQQIRRRLMRDLVRWVGSRSLVAADSGADAETLARGAMEAVAWLAKNRRGDRTAAAITEDQARDAAVRIFANAFDYAPRGATADPA